MSNKGQSQGNPAQGQQKSETYYRVVQAFSSAFPGIRVNQQSLLFNVPADHAERMIMSGTIYEEPGQPGEREIKVDFLKYLDDIKKRQKLVDEAQQGSQLQLSKKKLRAKQAADKAYAEEMKKAG